MEMRKASYNCRLFFLQRERVVATLKFLLYLPYTRRLLDLKISMQHTSRGRNLLLINIRLYIFILDLDSAQKSYEYIRILCVELSINREKKGCVLYRENKRYREMKKDIACRISKIIVTFVAKKVSMHNCTECL